MTPEASSSELGILIALVFIGGMCFGAITLPLYLWKQIVTGKRTVRGMVRQSELWATCPECGAIEPYCAHNAKGVEGR